MNKSESAIDYVSFFSSLKEVINGFVKSFTRHWKLIYIILNCKNKKVVDLALKHPTERVRKKNINRALRIIKKQKGMSS